jgi:hypothetical protein
MTLEQAREQYKLRGRIFVGGTDKMLEVCFMNGDWISGYHSAHTIDNHTLFFYYTFPLTEEDSRKIVN